MNNTTLQELISGRVDRGLADLLLAVYDAGRADGGGEVMTPASESMLALINTLRMRSSQLGADSARPPALGPTRAQLAAAPARPDPCAGGA